MRIHRLVLPLLLALAAPMALATPAAPEQTADPTAGPAPAAGTALLAGVRVSGVGHHPDQGITPDGIQALADRTLHDIAGGPLPAEFTFAQLEQVAAAVTRAYRDAGFVVAQAIVPVQTIGEDRILELQVVEGRLGRVHVQGSERYRDDVLAASMLGLVGQPLRQGPLDTAMLHARDLPGVSIRTLLQPGEQVGETDIVLVAEDSGRPWTGSVAISNHGTDATGRYRAEASVSAYNTFGAGDVFSASVGYGIDPADSWQGAFSFSLPSRRVSGLVGVLGLSRSHMELNSGPFAPLGINGPTTFSHVGADWKFINRPDLQVHASGRLIREESRLDGLGMTLSRHRFDVFEAGFSLRHVDQARRGINALQFSLRQSVHDDSDPQDWLYPAHDGDFLVARVGGARLQVLPANQRLYLRGSAQFTDSALVPIEQFSIGGPQSVRAFPLAGALGDRGVQATLEYQVDAPGFAASPSPFGGRAWGDVLSVNVFYDWGRVSPASGNRRLGVQPVTFEGAGVGFTLRLPGHPGLQLDVSAATPTGSTRPRDGDDIQAWARLGMTF